MALLDGLDHHPAEDSAQALKLFQVVPLCSPGLGRNHFSLISQRHHIKGLNARVRLTAF